MAAEIAGALDMTRVVVPPYAGLFSAFGLLFSNVERAASRTLFGRTTELKGSELARAFGLMETRLRAAFAAEGYAAGEVTLRRQAELRYAGQAYELTVVRHRSTPARQPPWPRPSPRSMSEPMAMRQPTSRSTW